MKKLTFIITVFISATLAGCTSSSSREASLYQMLKASRDSLHYYKTISKQMQKDLHAYEAYFNAAETLLDSIWVMEDSSVLEKATGDDYIEAKDKLPIFQNSYNQIKK